MLDAPGADRASQHPARPGAKRAHARTRPAAGRGQPRCASAARRRPAPAPAAPRRKPPPPPPAAARGARSGQSIRIDLIKLDKLIDTVGEW
jgi:two-component system chemotaxis sensor kinase CheA